MTLGVLIALYPGLARQVVKRWGWREIRAGEFMLPSGDKAMLLLDRPRACTGWPINTPAYLVPGWEKRTDAQTVREMIRLQVFVEPVPPTLAEIVPDV